MHYARETAAERFGIHHSVSIFDEIQYVGENVKVAVTYECMVNNG